MSRFPLFPIRIVHDGSLVVVCTTISSISSALSHPSTCRAVSLPPQRPTTHQAFLEASLVVAQMRTLMAAPSRATRKNLSGRGASATGRAYPDCPTSTSRPTATPASARPAQVPMVRMFPDLLPRQ